MSPLRIWWAKALLITIGLTIASIILLVYVMTVSWLDSIYLLFCWPGLLAVGTVFIAFIGLITASPKPQFNHFWEGTPWAVVGGLAAICIPLSEWLWSCCYQGDMYFLSCFGPLLFLMGFGIGGFLQKHVLTLILLCIVRVFGYHLLPILGETITMSVVWAVTIFALGLSFYWRFIEDKRGKGA